MKENIVKQTAKDLGMTYRELADKLGYSEGALKTAVSTGKVSSSMETAIHLYIENRELKEKIEDSEVIKQTLKEWLQ